MLLSRGVTEESWRWVSRSVRWESGDEPMFD